MHFHSKISSNSMMIGITLVLILFSGVFSQNEYNDNDFNETVDLDLIRDINNLSGLENSATQSNLEKTRNFPEIKISQDPSEKVDVLGEKNQNHYHSSLNLTDKVSSVIDPQSLVINVAEGSELITAPNKSTVIMFEVTNHKNTTLDIIFYCEARKSLINSLTPSRIHINPEETVKLKLILKTQPTTYQDEIILTANIGLDNIEKKVFIDVVTQIDNTAPSLEYSFLRNCSKYTNSNCNGGNWTIEIKTKDSESGLQRVTANSKDIYFPESYTIGSKEQITSIYSESCCNVNIEMVATDRAGNKNEVQTTLNHARLSRLVDTKDYNSNIFPQQTVSITVAQGSELITSSNKLAEITFEVTNYKNTTLDVVFYCTTTQSIIASLTPARTQIASQETLKLQLVLKTRETTYQDEVTLTANIGSATISTKVFVDVGTQTETDTTAPSLDYSFLSDCSKIVFADCIQGTWTMEIKAKDTQSGVLQVTSNPKGIYFPKGFTVGTKDEVTGTYSESCCNADLQITAIDRAGNKNQISTNAYRATWGPGQIAAVVLGVLLLIAVIILAVFLIRKLIKKKESYGLATYRSGGAKSGSSNFE